MRELIVKIEIEGGMLIEEMDWEMCQNMVNTLELKGISYYKQVSNSEPRETQSKLAVSQSVSPKTTLPPEEEGMVNIDFNFFPFDMETVSQNTIY